MKTILASVAVLLMLPVCATGTVAAADDTGELSRVPLANDVIARVGDQTITFSEINTALNSSAIVGVSVPALGTPERDTARIILLDRFVSANLLYLDALGKGADQEPAYRRAISRFSNAMLAGLYRQTQQAGDIPVSDEEIETYFKQNVTTDAGLTDDIRLQIEATLRRHKLQQRLSAAQQTLRDDTDVQLFPENLAVEDDKKRTADTPLAKVGTETITWGQVGDRIMAAGKGATLADPTADVDQARRDALERGIDLHIMVQKAKAAGLEEDPLYKRRVKEYGKTLLTNRHREQLIEEMEPSGKDLKAWYEANRNSLIVPEARRLQMVVVGTKAEADNLKARIEAGEMTMYVAARDHSIAADARQSLGEVGWVNRGESTPSLDEVIFSLGPGEIGGPVESPAGWHLVKVLEVNGAKYNDFADEATRKLARRRYLHDKLDAYTAELRMNRYTVEVYQDRFVQLAQQEADMIKALAEKAKQPDSVTQKRIEELRKFMKP